MNTRKTKRVADDDIIVTKTPYQIAVQSLTDDGSFPLVGPSHLRKLPALHALYLCFHGTAVSDEYVPMAWYQAPPGFVAVRNQHNSIVGLNQPSGALDEPKFRQLALIEGAIRSRAANVLKIGKLYIFIGKCYEESGNLYLNRVFVRISPPRDDSTELERRVFEFGMGYAKSFDPAQWKDYFHNAVTFASWFRHTTGITPAWNPALIAALEQPTSPPFLAILSNPILPTPVRNYVSGCLAVCLGSLTAEELLVHCESVPVGSRVSFLDKAGKIRLPLTAHNRQNPCRDDKGALFETKKLADVKEDEVVLVNNKAFAPNQLTAFRESAQPVVVAKRGECGWRRKTGGKAPWEQVELEVVEPTFLRKLLELIQEATSVAPSSSASVAARPPVQVDVTSEETIQFDLE